MLGYNGELTEAADAQSDLRDIEADLNNKDPGYISDNPLELPFNAKQSSQHLGIQPTSSFARLRKHADSLPSSSRKRQKPVGNDIWDVPDDDNEIPQYTQGLQRTASPSASSTHSNSSDEVLLTRTTQSHYLLSKHPQSEGSSLVDTTVVESRSQISEIDELQQ